MDTERGAGQVRVYLGKCFRLFKTERRWRVFLSTLLIMLLISLVTGPEMFASYRETRSGLFAIVCACIWIGLFNSIQSVCRERDILKREHRTGLRMSAYVTAHALYELALCAAEALIVTGAVLLRNWRTLPVEGLLFTQLLLLYFSFLLILYASDCIALLISSIVKSENAAMTVMPFVLILQLVLAGTVFELRGAVSTLSSLTVSKWGMRAVCAVANANEAVHWGYRLSHDTGCEPTWGNLIRTGAVLLLFCLASLGLSVLALGRVDRDQR